MTRMVDMCNYNEDMCETCVFAKYDCWYPMGGKVVAGWDDKGVGIIVACKNYEKDEGQDEVNIGRMRKALDKLQRKYNSNRIK